MKSFDEHNAYQTTRAEERDEVIIERWKASALIDGLGEINDALADGAKITPEIIRELRKEVAKSAERDREKILAEWAIARASERS